MRRRFIVTTRNSTETVMVTTKRVTRRGSIEGRVRKPMELKVKQRRQQPTNPKAEVPNPSRRHRHKPTHQTNPVVEKVTRRVVLRLLRRRRGRLGSLTSWPVGNPHPGVTFGPRVSLVLAAAVERDELVVLDESFADRAFLGVRVVVKPTVQARPAEEVAAESDDGVLS